MQEDSAASYSEPALHNSRDRGNAHILFFWMCHKIVLVEEVIPLIFFLPNVKLDVNPSGCTKFTGSISVTLLSVTKEGKVCNLDFLNCSQWILCWDSKALNQTQHQM